VSDFNVSRLGQSNLAGDTKDLFLKVFANEVMTTFGVENVMRPLHRVRTIASGKSASFPNIGNVSASYHTPGAAIVGTPIPHAERVINIDGLLQANVSIANIDEAMNHYDVRSPYTQEIARALNRAYDARVARVVARAARTAGVVNATVYNNSGSSGAIPAAYTGASTATWDPRDTSLADANAKVTASVLLSKLWYCARRMDEKNCPQEGRVALMAPAQYYLLIENGGSMSASPLNRDWGGAGSYANGTLPMVANLRIVKTNNFPTTDVTSDSTTATSGNNYNGDFSKTAALVFQAEAAGTVQLLDLAAESEYSVSRQATLMLAKYAVGHGVLRPECALEIATGEVAAAKVLPTA
jgi:hypothetical protein